MARSRARETQREEYPGLFQDADAAARSGHQRYKVLVALNLIAVSAGALAGSFAVTAPEHQRVVGWIAAGIFLAGIALSAAIALLRPERVWYGARAVAESAKSLAWKYMMGAEPFPISLSPKDADSRLVANMAELLSQRQYLATAFIRKEPLMEEITEYMRATRSAPVQARRDVYVLNRVRQQKAWYANGAARARALQRRYFVLLLGAQGVAVFLTICMAMDGSVWHGSGFFAAVAGSAAAWLQVGRHQEVAQSYAFASHELGLIEVLSAHVNTEELLASFVSDAETAISREHTSWIARRERR